MVKGGKNRFRLPVGGDERENDLDSELKTHKFKLRVLKNVKYGPGNDFFGQKILFYYFKKFKRK